MSCSDRHKDVRGHCVCEVVRAIKDIQDAAEAHECMECTTSCFLEPLGDLNPRFKRDHADTRVFTLTTREGKLLPAFFHPKRHHHHGHDDHDDHGKHKRRECISVFFRVEEIFDNCCATLRVLRPMHHKKEVDLTTDGHINLDKLCEVTNWEATNSCISVDLKCFCAVQCIADVNLGICD